MQPQSTTHLSVTSSTSLGIPPLKPSKSPLKETTYQIPTVRLVLPLGLIYQSIKQRWITIHTGVLSTTSVMLISSCCRILVLILKMPAMIRLATKIRSLITVRGMINYLIARVTYKFGEELLQITTHREYGIILLWLMLWYLIQFLSFSNQNQEE